MNTGIDYGSETGFITPQIGGELQISLMAYIRMFTKLKDYRNVLEASI